MGVAGVLLGALFVETVATSHHHGYGGHGHGGAPTDGIDYSNVQATADGRVIVTPVGLNESQHTFKNAHIQIEDQFDMYNRQMPRIMHIVQDNGKSIPFRAPAISYDDGAVSVENGQRVTHHGGHRDVMPAVQRPVTFKTGADTSLGAAHAQTATGTSTVIIVEPRPQGRPAAEQPAVNESYPAEGTARLAPLNASQSRQAYDDGAHLNVLSAKTHLTFSPDSGGYLKANAQGLHGFFQKNDLAKIEREHPDFVQKLLGGPDSGLIFDGKNVVIAKPLSGKDFDNFVQNADAIGEAVRGNYENATAAYQRAHANDTPAQDVSAAPERRGAIVVQPSGEETPAGTALPNSGKQSVTPEASSAPDQATPAAGALTTEWLDNHERTKTALKQVMLAELHEFGQGSLHVNSDINKNGFGVDGLFGHDAAKKGGDTGKAIAEFKANMNYPATAEMDTDAFKRLVEGFQRTAGFADNDITGQIDAKTLAAINREKDHLQADKGVRVKDGLIPDSLPQLSGGMAAARPNPQHSESAASAIPADLSERQARPGKFDDAVYRPGGQKAALHTLLENSVPLFKQDAVEVPTGETVSPKAVKPPAQDRTTPLLRA